jgi:hypothetical protein
MPPASSSTTRWEEVEFSGSRLMSTYEMRNQQGQQQQGQQQQQQGQQQQEATVLESNCGKFL